MAKDISAPHCFRKDGIFYFERRVPSDLQEHYTRSKISYSLRTRQQRVAAARARRAAERLDEYWYHLRLSRSDLPGRHLVRDPAPASGLRLVAPEADLPADEASPSHEGLSLSEATRLYLRLKGTDRPDTFHRAAERSCGYVVEVCGDKDIRSYTRRDATRFRDALVARGLAGSSITRVLGTVRSVVNLAAGELGIAITNPFSNLYYDRKAGVQDRAALPLSAIRAVQEECVRMDDELRWLAALVSDSGMRLGEAAGLARGDFVLDGEIPHVIIEEKPWRRLKNAGSSRKVPLIGASLWAARRIAAACADGTFAFPRYNRGDQTNANSASAALNKWMKPLVPERCTIHSFRRSMRDRLRAVECPADIVDQIGGWQTEGVGHAYGSGYPLHVLHKWLKAVE